jgi:hypothetical protein
MLKTEQIKVMGRIRKTAIVTIPAASSSSVRTDFLEDRTVPNVPLPIEFWQKRSQWETFDSREYRRMYR